MKLGRWWFLIRPVIGWPYSVQRTHEGNGWTLWLGPICIQKMHRGTAHKGK